MFGILKVSNSNNKEIKPLCYFENEKAAYKVFKELSNSSDSKLLLVTNFTTDEKDCSKFPIIEEYRPSIIKPKKVYNYPNKYESRKTIVEESELFKKIQKAEQEQEQERKRKLNTIIIDSKSNKPEKLPIDYYINKNKKPVSTDIYLFRYELLEYGTDIIFISKTPWPLEYDPKDVRIKKESPFYDRYYKISCYAKNKTEAEKIIKSELKKYFKEKK